MPLTARDLRSLRTLCGIRTAAKRRDLIERGGGRMQNLLRQLAVNLLKGNIPLTPSQLKKLKKYKRVIRRLADRRTSAANRKRITQSGGGFMAMLPLAISALSTLTSLVK